MGIELTLVVDAFERDSQMPLAYERIRIDANYAFFDDIKETAIPFRQNRQLWWYGYGGIDRRTDDPYGDRLTSTMAKHVADAMASHELSAKNKAVMAYMNALPPDTEVFLWWH